jgi:hypothetical protein
MPTKHYAQVRGSVIRVTRLDSCGNPVTGASSVVVSKRVSTVTVDEVTEDGTDVRERNFADELCIVDDAKTAIIGYTVDVALCGVDPELISFMTGQPTVTNAAGDIVGFDVNSDIDLDGFGFAIEVWSRISGVACGSAGSRPWGYTVFPFLKGGRLGGFSFENGAVQFTVSGAQTRDGNGWGVGPFNVDRNNVTTNEVQSLATTGTPTGGTFRLTYAGAQTAPIAYNATSAAVQSALEALSNIAPGDVVVTGGPGPTTPYVFTFGGTLAGANVAQMTVAATYTGGTSPTATITTTTGGVAGAPSPLSTALSANTHYRNILVTLDPPAPTLAAAALA